MPRSSRVSAVALRPTGLAALGVFAVALVARLVHLLHVGAVTGTNGYDQSVYYAASDALVHGRVPYRGEFVFLHPPGIAVAGMPFAFLGRMTTASTGFLAENVAFSVLAAATAALITVVARRAGAPRAAAVAGGLVYATWSVSVSAGSSARLEPLGDFLFVVSVLLLVAGRIPPRRHLILAGVVIGLLINVKLWWVVPIAVLFLVLSRLDLGRVRALAVVPISAVATAVVIDLPFLLLSNGRMFSSVVSSQLGRDAVQGTPTGDFSRLSTMVRLERMSGVEGVMNRLFGMSPAEADIRVRVVTAAVCALVVLMSVLALRTSLGRIFVPVLAAQVAILLTTPVYFPYYGDFVAVALGMVLAAATGSVAWRRFTLPLSALWPVAALATLLLMATAPRGPSVVAPADSAALVRATKNVRCVVADTPRVLITLDALDRSFENGCRNWVDFQGVGHGGGPDPAAFIALPVATRAWKQAVSRYLGSGDVVALSDPNVRSLLGPERVRDLTRGRVLIQSQNVAIYWIDHSQPPAGQ